MAIFDFMKQKKEQGVALVKTPGKHEEEQPSPDTREGIYQLFLKFYESIPMVNAIVNVQADQVVQDYFFEGPNDEKLKEWSDLVNLTTFFHQMTKNLLIYGNCYTEVVKQGDKIVKLKILDSRWMDVYRTETGRITGYSQIIGRKRLVLWGTTGNKQKDQGFTKKISKIDSIVHFKHNIIGSDKYGRSIIAPLIPNLQSKIVMEKDLGKLLEKYIAPLIHATVGSDEMPAQDTAVTDVAQSLHNLHKESEIATSHLVKLDVLDFYSKGMDISEPMQHIDRQIMAGGQTPAILLGLQQQKAGDKGAEVQLRAFGRHIKSIQRDIKVQFEDLIIVGQELGTPEDKIIWEKAEEREWESDIDILRGMVTDGMLTPQKANDLLPLRFREELPEMPDPMELQNQGFPEDGKPRPTQRKTEPKVKDNPNNPQKTTKNAKSMGRRVDRSTKE